MIADRPDVKIMPLTLRLLLVGASAFAFVLAFPPTKLHLFGWVALVPFLVALRASSFTGALALAALWGMLSAYGVTDWLPSAVAHYYQQPIWLGAMLFASAAFLMGAAEYMGFAAFYWWSARRRSTLLPVAASAAWVVAELGRGRLFTGNPWGLLGYTQSALDPSSRVVGLPVGIVPHHFVQIADLAGVYGVSFVLACCSVTIAELILSVRERSVGRRDAVRLVVGFGVLAIGFAYGTARLHRTIGTERPTVRVAAVQGNVDLGSQWRTEFYGANLDVYLDLTERVIAESAPALVFWPENAMSFFVDREPDYRAAIARVIGPMHVQLVAGAPRFDGPVDSPTYFNSAFVLSPDGTVLDRYDKGHLLPFTEYFPLGSSGFLRRKFARVREIAPGTDTTPINTRAGQAAVTLCNEVMFPEIVRARVRDGADFIVNLTNDTWVPSVKFAEHQLAIAAMRAVEQRRYLVRASTSGPSAVVSPDGVVVARTAPLARGLLVGEVRPRRESTVYGRYGDWFAWSCFAACALAGIVWRRSAP